MANAQQDGEFIGEIMRGMNNNAHILIYPVPCPDPDPATSDCRPTINYLLFNIILNNVTYRSTRLFHRYIYGFSQAEPEAL